LREVFVHLTKGGWSIGRLAMCGMLCALFEAGALQSARAEEPGGKSPCLEADSATRKQIDKLVETKQERYRIAKTANLKPWMDKVKRESKTARANVTKALEICRNDEGLGPRARQATVSNLKKRLRQLDETDRQMMMMKALGNPQPRIDPSVMRVLER